MRQAYRWNGMNNPYRYRDDVVRAIGFTSYRAYLKSDLWKSIRERVLAREPSALCDKCRTRDATQVHHRAYDPATMRGQSIDSLNKLCARCHRAAELPDKRQDKYERLKGAGDYMLQRRHPSRNKSRLVRRANLKGSGKVV